MLANCIMLAAFVAVILTVLERWSSERQTQKRSHAPHIPESK